MVLGAVIGGGMAWLNYKPVSLKWVLPYVQEYTSPYGITLDAQEITLGFNRRFTLIFDGAKLKDRDGRTRAKVSRAEISFANRRILLGQFSPKHAVVEGAVVHLDVRQEGLFLGEFPLGVEGDGKGIVEQLNDWENIPGAYDVRTVSLKNSHVLLRDKRTQITWLVQDIGANFSRYPHDGERVAVTGKVRQKQVITPMPFLLSGQHGAQSPWLEVSVKFENSDTDFVKPYIPPALQEILKTRGQVEIGTRLGVQNKLEDPYFVLRLGETRLFPEEAYTHPLEFKRLTLRGRYEAPADTLWIQELNLVDKSDITLDISGKIEELEGTPRLDLTAKGDINRLEQLKYYLPDKVIDKTVSWMDKALSDVQMDNFVLTYKGRPTDMPHCMKTCGITAQADITSGNIRFFDDAEPATKVQGTFLLKEDYINVAATQAEWVGQKGKEVSITLAGLFAPGDSYLYIEGGVEGRLDLLLAGLKDGVGLEDIPAAQGQQKGTFYVSMPLYEGDKETLLSDIRIDVDSDISSLRMPIDALGGEVLTAPRADLVIKNKKLNFKAEGQFFDTPLTVDWKSHLEKPDTSAHLKVSGRVPSAVLSTHIKSYADGLEGEADIKADIRQINAQKYTVSVQHDLSDLALAVPKLNWRKKKGTALSGEMQGQILLSGKKSEVNMDMLSLTGDQVEIAGSIYVDKNKAVTAQFTPFKLGEQDMAIQWKPGEIELVGNRLDARGINILAKQEDVLPEELNVRLALENVLLKHGSLQRLNVQAKRLNSTWQQADIEGLTEQYPFSLNLMPLEGERQIKVKAQDTGKLLSTLADFRQIRDGALEGHLKLHENEEGETVGHGFISVHKTRLVNVPVMAQLLALLSLEPLMNSSSGISFHEVNIPLKVEPGAVHIPKAEFKGVSMDMQLDGYYSFDSQVNFNGRLIPAVGLNKTIAHIPLVGTLLSGSQDGVVVADFKIKGLAEDPKVSAKPFSLITPGLLKDIFGGIFGKD
ncbi:MAG: AsmA-like C-terminal domain-containing protein [Alphaproteobacteria bacterium]|nr:AsmA-like C-terminal domain-containing protein [Alphaproteobacteria bacterium]